MNDVTPELRGARYAAAGSDHTICWRKNLFLEVGTLVEKGLTADSNAAFTYMVTLLDASATLRGTYGDMTFPLGDPVDGQPTLTASISMKPGQTKTAVLPFGGTLLFGDNLAGDTLTGAKNGGEDYANPRQDIFLAEDTDTPSLLRITGSLDGGMQNGSIWVWSEGKKNYETLKPFAQVVSGLSDKTYLAFRNARTDAETFCGGDTYLTGRRNGDEYMYWSGGFDVFFIKRDGFGEPLPNAEFTLFTAPACSEADRFLREGNPLTPKSDNAGRVLFEQVPTGLYYMRETKSPDTEAYKLSETVYRVIVGAAKTAELGETLPDGASFLIQRMTAGTGGTLTVDPAGPDIAVKGIMNESMAEGKAILKKVDKNTKEPLTGAVFDMLRWDGTVLYTGLTSGENGTFWIGSLPWGTYYLHETTAPPGSGDYQSNTGNWYSLTVNDDGVKVSLDPVPAPFPEN